MRKFTAPVLDLLVKSKLSVKKKSIPVTKEVVLTFVGQNVPESMITRALQALKIKFEAQSQRFGGSILGGAKLDFFLPDYMVDLEYNGPFHGTTEGKAKDALRTLALAKDGIRLVVIKEFDLPDLKRVIMEKIGAPVPGTLG